MDPNASWSVRVPASTSNLGPGFDFLGLALGLYLDVRASVRNEPEEAALGAAKHAVRYGLAAPGWDAADDLILRTLVEWEKHVGTALPPLRLEVHTEIPVGRGFGSSGASVAAALLIAAAVHHDQGRDEISVDRLLELALRLEGHPDNGTASLLGGCTAAVPTPKGGESALAVVQIPVHESIGLAIAWPEEPLFTAQARAVLPATVSHRDAVENPRRLALLLEGLRTGDARLLRLGVADRLHESYRRALIPGCERALASAVEHSAHAACLSGAGSGLVALGPIENMAEIARAMAAELDGGKGLEVVPVRDEPQVVRAGNFGES